MVVLGNFPTLLLFSCILSGDTCGAMSNPPVRTSWRASLIGDDSRSSLRSRRAVDAVLAMMGSRTDLLGLALKFVGLRGLSLGSFKSTVALEGLLLRPIAFFIADMVGLANIVPLDNLRKSPRS